MMNFAVEFNRDISMLVDDAGDAGLRTLEMLAVETDRRGMHGRWFRIRNRIFES